MKINTKLVKHSLEFQTVYEANIDFDVTYENLNRLGYSPKRHPAGRPTKKDGIQQQDAGNFTFKSKSGPKVNIFPKGPLHRIQTKCKSLEERRKLFRELVSVLIPSGGHRLFILPRRSIINFTVIEDQDEFFDRFFSDVESAYQNYLSNYISKEQQIEYENYLLSLFSKKLKSS